MMGCAAAGARDTGARARLRAEHGHPEVREFSKPMRMPLKLMMDLGRYMRRKRKSGERYFPLVLMLEPLHACNLACIGCGRIVEYKDATPELRANVHEFNVGLYCFDGSRLVDELAKGKAIEKVLRA